jgi:hypothetical protein
MSDKIKPHHLERKAILYIRQSSLYQVNHNLESHKLQYAMEERLQQLGWREIEVVDDDLGPVGSRDRSLALALNAWWQKFVWGRWVHWPRGRYRDWHGTAESGNSGSKCVGWSTWC